MPRSVRRTLGLIGLVLLTVFVLFALFPKVIAPYGEKEMFQPWLEPSSSHLLGTNRLGYDVLTELVYGTRTTLVTGLVASVVSLLLGGVIGALGAEDNLLGHGADTLTDMMAMLPRLVLLIVLASFLGSGRTVLIVLISVFSWAPTARAVRTRTLSLKNQSFMENLLVEGFSRGHILIHHTIPNLSDILLSRFLLGVNSAIMMESTLSFLGYGDLYHPTWGTMVNLAHRNGAFMRQAYTYLLSPGVAIMLLSLSFYFISLALEGRRESVEEA